MIYFLNARLNSVIDTVEQTGENWEPKTNSMQWNEIFVQIVKPSFAITFATFVENKGESRKILSCFLANRTFWICVPLHKWTKLKWQQHQQQQNPHRFTSSRRLCSMVTIWTWLNKSFVVEHWTHAHLFFLYFCSLLFSYLENVQIQREHIVCGHSVSTWLQSKIKIGGLNAFQVH